MRCRVRVWEDGGGGGGGRLGRWVVLGGGFKGDVKKQTTAKTKQKSS